MAIYIPPNRRWSAVIPVYNEERYLLRTLESLVAQAETVRVIVVDNGSTDDGIRAARAKFGGFRRVEFVEEPVPGQVHALARGLALADGEFVAVCDADTWYPPHYLTVAETLLDTGGESCVAASAWLRPERGGMVRTLGRQLHVRSAMTFLPRQNHTSGAAHCFRLAALRAAGGYDPLRWPFVLKDHELFHRVLQLGFQAHAADLWCISSDRRSDRRAVRWTLLERLAYHLTPFHLKDRFFHGFLADRFRRRGQADTVLRQRSWLL